MSNNKDKNIENLNATKKIDWKKENLQAFIANIIIFFIFSIIFFIWIYPEFSATEAKKEDLQKKVESFEKLEKNWISFSDFNKKIEEEIKKVWNDKKQKEKLKSILLLKKYLSDLKQENKDQKFLDFLEKKDKELEKIENSTNMIDLERNIENILPSYVENNEEVSSLSDLTFINYLEKLFLAFNLKNNWEIWIWNIVALDDWEKKSKLFLSNNQIFYIPIKLDLTWKKINILKFLYYLENVWKISISEINIPSKNKKSKKTKKILKINIYSDDNLKTEQNIMNETNIYSNILSTISDISFSKYFDSKLAKEKNIKTEQDLLKWIKNTQWDDKYQVKLELHFFVKWLAKYKIKDYVLSLLKDYKLILKDINSFSKKSKQEIFKWKNPLLISKIESLWRFLKSKEKEMLNISKNLSSQKNLVWVYNKLKKIEDKLKQAKIILKELKK